MDPGPSSQSQHDEPTETTALLSAPAGSESSVAPQVEQAGSGEHASTPPPPSKWLVGNSWASLVLSVLTCAFSAAIEILDHFSPRDFHRDIREEPSIVAFFAVIAFAAGFWNLRRGIGAAEPRRTVLNLIIDALVAFYVTALGGRTLNWAPSLSSCWTYYDPSTPECPPFRDAFNIVATIWAVLATLLGLTHLFLFYFRIRRHYIVHGVRTVAWPTTSQDGISNEGVIASLNFTVGPIGFDARLRLFQPASDSVESQAQQRTVQPEATN